MSGSISQENCLKAQQNYCVSDKLTVHIHHGVGIHAQTAKMTSAQGDTFSKRLPAAVRGQWRRLLGEKTLSNFKIAPVKKGDERISHKRQKQKFSDSFSWFRHPVVTRLTHEEIFISTKPSPCRSICVDMVTRCSTCCTEVQHRARVEN